MLIVQINIAKTAKKVTIIRTSVEMEIVTQIQGKVVNQNTRIQSKRHAQIVKNLAIQ